MAVVLDSLAAMESVAKEQRGWGSGDEGNRAACRTGLAGSIGNRPICAPYSGSIDLRDSLGSTAGFPVVRLDTSVDRIFDHHPSCGLLTSTFGVGQHSSSVRGRLPHVSLFSKTGNVGLGRPIRHTDKPLDNIHGCPFIRSCAQLLLVVPFFILLRYPTNHAHVSRPSWLRSRPSRVANDSCRTFLFWRGVQHCGPVREASLMAETQSGFSSHGI